MTVNADVTISSGPVRLKITGLTRLMNQASKAGADSNDMRDLMHELGMIVVRDARTRVPSETGTLRKTLRAGRGKTKAVVRAGSRAVPYGGVIHYGTPPGFRDSRGRAMNLQRNNFLVKSIKATQGRVLNALEAGILDILKKNNLI